MHMRLPHLPSPTQLSASVRVCLCVCMCVCVCVCVCVQLRNQILENLRHVKPVGACFYERPPDLMSADAVRATPTPAPARSGSQPPGPASHTNGPSALLQGALMKSDMTCDANGDVTTNGTGDNDRYNDDADMDVRLLGVKDDELETEAGNGQDMALD